MYYFRSNSLIIINAFDLAAGLPFHIRMQHADAYSRCCRVMSWWFVVGEPSEKTTSFTSHSADLCGHTIEHSISSFNVACLQSPAHIAKLIIRTTMHLLFDTISSLFNTICCVLHAISDRKNIKPRKNCVLRFIWSIAAIVQIVRIKLQFIGQSGRGQMRLHQPQAMHANKSDHCDILSLVGQTDAANVTQPTDATNGRQLNSHSSCKIADLSMPTWQCNCKCLVHTRRDHRSIVAMPEHIAVAVDGGGDNNANHSY